jgi:hypothetical protein
LQLDARHGPDGVHVFGVPTHSPPEQAKLLEQRSVEGQGSPFSALLVVHAPVCASQSDTLQAGVSIEQSFGVPLQAPFVHVPAVKQPVVPQAPPLVPT